MLKHSLKALAVAAMAASQVMCSSSDKSMGNNGVKYKEGEAKPAEFWWPNKINLQPLRQHAEESNPYGEGFDYAREFKKLNLDAVKKDIAKVLTDSQAWWPADWGNYGPFFIRMAWHSAGTYRVSDGRGGAGGGQLRFEPQNSWPDNGNLDKARRLLWPVKKKYGKQISWADLMVLTGNVSLEQMGFEPFGFAGGRADDWEPDLVYWGPEQKMLDANRRDKDGKLKKPLGAVQMGLIYVNPEGPGGNMDPISAAKSIRESFGQMAMNDEETAALIAGGHTFGKGHGARSADCVGPEPTAAGLEEQGLGWKNKCGTGKGGDAVTSGLEGAWTATPTQWSNLYLTNLYAFEWKQHTTPAGGKVWIPKDENAHQMVPDAHDKNKRNPPIMYTTDLALREDPAYRKITQRWLENPKEFENAFARAWFKLTHRDMGPRARYLGKDVPKEVLTWQDPVPTNSVRIGSGEVASLKKQILNSGLSTGELVRTAWAAAASFRGSDMRGGANGGRLRLAPQKDWAVNNPAEVAKVLGKLADVKKKSGSKISMADLIVLGGAAALESAASKAGIRVSVPFKSGRTDASQEQTDVESFNELEPAADGFRNYYTSKSYLDPVAAMVDKANLLNLTVPEMTVLVGGLRVLGANHDASSHGVFTNKVGTLSNDFFVNLLDMSTSWQKSSDMAGLYVGVDRASGKKKYTATPVDLMFGSSSELRAISEVYAADDGKTKFVQDFVKAWVKVMQLDRFDI